MAKKSLKAKAPVPTSVENVGIQDVTEWAKGETNAASVIWSQAEFQDRAEELRQRLAAWHVHDECAPVGFPDRLGFEKERRRTFRDAVLCGEHCTEGKRWSSLASVPVEQAIQEGVGTIFENRPSGIDKAHTIWLMRDFFEHLSDAGNSNSADYLRLKLDRILDAEMYGPRMLTDFENSDEVLKADVAAYRCFAIGGRQIDQDILGALVAAARNLSIIPPCSIPSPKHTKGKRVLIDEQMRGVYADEPDSISWTAVKWAARLGCDSSTVRKTAFWKRTLPKEREFFKQGSATVTRNKNVK